MHLSVTHTTRYTYDPQALGATLRLRLFPPVTGSQQVSEWSVRVNGEDVRPGYKDAQGDAVALWHHHSGIDEIEIAATGEIVTKDTSGVLSDQVETVPKGVYLRNTALTAPDERLRELAAEVDESDPLARMHALSLLAHESISYRPGATSAGATAAEALALGAGVCQDQTHVLISLARLASIPARYVVGYLFNPEGESEAEETHAWAEVHIPGLGWVGFDTTNQLCPTDRYVRLCIGLDAADAAPIRGALIGDAEETLAASVTVAAKQAQSQSQS